MAPTKSKSKTAAAAVSLKAQKSTKTKFKTTNTAAAVSLKAQKSTKTKFKTTNTTAAVSLKAQKSTKTKFKTTNATAAGVSLKLLIDKKHKKVLFAEAGKDFVDFLFTLLSLPVGTVVRLISDKGMVGGIGKLYDSVENLDQDYMQPHLTKDVLLKPKQQPITGVDQVFLPLLTNGHESTVKKLYTCQSHCQKYSYYSTRESYATDDPKAICPACNKTMAKEMAYVAPPAGAAGESSTEGEGGKGFVRGLVTYMIMDDLEVKPTSAISSIALLNNMNIMDVSGLEEQVVPLDMDKGLKLLKESLESNEVLTKVFLRKN